MCRRQLRAAWGVSLLLGWPASLVGCQVPELELLQEPTTFSTGYGGAGGAFAGAPAGLPRDFRVRYLRVVMLSQLRDVGLSITINELEWASPAGEYPRIKPLPQPERASTGRGGEDPEEAFDGERTTRWAAPPLENLPSWIGLDLGEHMPAPTAARITIGQADLRAPASLEFQASADGKTWYRQKLIQGLQSWSEPDDRFQAEGEMRTFGLPSPERWSAL